MNNPPTNRDASAHLHVDKDRGTGRTTEQMRNAPPDSIYVWCNHHLDYPKLLARRLDRYDLRIMSPSAALERGGERLLGLHRYIVLDHALWDHAISTEMHQGIVRVRHLNSDWQSRNGSRNG